MGLPVLGALLTPTANPPSISGTVSLSSQASGTSFVVTIPAHIAGDVLVVFVAYDGGTDITASAGWTIEVQDNTSRGIALFTRTATAAGHTLTITNNNNSDIVAHAYAFTGAQGDVDASIVAGNDPPNHTNGWGSIGNLWFAAHNVSAGLAPLGFANVETSSSGAARLITCRKDDDAATLNPTAFSDSGTHSITACVRPR